MYVPPTLAALSQSVRAAVRAEIPATDPWVWPNNLYVVSKVVALALRGLYVRLGWVHMQRFASTAEGDALEMHGADIGVTRLAAVIATGTASAATTIGTAIPAGTRLVRGDGATFVTTADATAVAGTTNLQLRANDEGKAGNTDSGAPLTVETPIAGIGAITVASITGGAEIENDASLRARILDKKRNPPHGGSPAEYREWARQVPGVTRVFVQRSTPQPGSVTVYVMTDDTTANGVPGAGDVAAVQAALDANAPANADAIAAVPTPVAVDVTVAVLPNTQAVQDAVKAELLAMFRRRAEPGTAGTPFVYSRSWIREAVSIAAGEVSNTLSLPATDVSCGDGEIAVLGTLTFT